MMKIDETRWALAGKYDHSVNLLMPANSPYDPIWQQMHESLRVVRVRITEIEEENDDKG